MWNYFAKTFTKHQLNDSHDCAIVSVYNVFFFQNKKKFVIVFNTKVYWDFLFVVVNQLFKKKNNVNYVFINHTQFISHKNVRNSFSYDSSIETYK